MPPSRSASELTRGEVAALQVVEPGALVELLVQADEAIGVREIHTTNATSPVRRALSRAPTTFATLIPSLSSTTSPGALAPKRSMPTESSANRAHPNVVAASTDSTGTPAGKSVSRNAASWAASRSQLGRLTTCAPTPSPASCSAAETARATSLPVRDDDQRRERRLLCARRRRRARPLSRRCTLGCPDATARARSARRASPPPSMR